MLWGVGFALAMAPSWAAANLPPLPEIEIDGPDMDMGGLDGALLMGPGPVLLGSTDARDRERSLDGIMQAMLGAEMHPGAESGGRSKEQELDSAMQAMAKPGDAILEDDGPSMSSAGTVMDPPHDEVVIEQDGDGPPRVVSNSGRLPPGFPPLEAFGDMFPGPVAVHGPAHPAGQDLADAMVANMVQDLDGNFRRTVLPAVQQAADASREPYSCKSDVDRHCKGATSPLHCLGQHKADISKRCRKDVGKSVPFACSDTIDRSCDLLQQSILTCLSRQTNLPDDCADTVTVAQKAVTATKAMKTTLRQAAKPAGPGCEGCDGHSGVLRMLLLVTPRMLLLVVVLAVVAYAMECTQCPRWLVQLSRGSSAEGSKLLTGSEMPTHLDL